MGYIPIEDIWSICSNKYLAVVLAAKEARRINKAPKEEERGEKPTSLALQRLVSNDIQYRVVKED